MVAAMMVLMMAQIAPKTDMPPAPSATERVCRRLGDTGTRLPQPRICHSAAEWREIDRQADELLHGISDASRYSPQLGIHKPQ